MSNVASWSHVNYMPHSWSYFYIKHFFQLEWLLFMETSEMKEYAEITLCCYDFTHF